MRASDFIFTPLDAARGLRSLTWRHYAGVVLSVALFILGGRVAGDDVAFLAAGIVFMIATGASYRLPLVFAILGLLGLMAMSPFVHEGNTLDGASERLAVIVFFMLIFGVSKWCLMK